MAIKAIVGFDHLPQNTVGWAAYADHGLTQAGAAATSSVISDGWIVCTNAAAGSANWSFPTTAYLLSPVAKIWVGVRVRLSSIVNPAAGILYFGATYLFIVTDIPAASNGDIVYLEFSYTVATGVCERWVNGIALSNVAAPSAQRTALIKLESKGTTANQLDWRDIYICDDQGASTGLPIGPLGAQQVIAVTANTATAGDWTTVPVGGSLLTAVNDPSSLPTALVGLSSITKGKLTIGFSTDVPDGILVHAVEYTVGLAGAVGTSINCGTVIKEDTASVAGKEFTKLAQTYTYSNSIGVFHTNPHGLPWDTVSINATDLILSPDV